MISVASAGFYQPRSGFFFVQFWGSFEKSKVKPFKSNILSDSLLISLFISSSSLLPSLLLYYIILNFGLLGQWTVTPVSSADVPMTDANKTGLLAH